MHILSPSYRSILMDRYFNDFMRRGWDAASGFSLNFNIWFHEHLSECSFLLLSKIHHDVSYSVYFWNRYYFFHYMDKICNFQVTYYLLLYLNVWKWLGALGKLEKIFCCVLSFIVLGASFHLQLSLIFSEILHENCILYIHIYKT